MAASHGKDLDFFVDGYDIGTYFHELGVAGSRDEAEVTGFGATAKSFVGGLKDTNVTLGGHFDGAANAIDQLLNAAFAADAAKVFIIAPQGDTRGNRAILGQFKYIEYSIDASRDDAVTISAQGHANANSDSGYMLHALSAETANFNHTGVDWGAASTSSVGFSAAIECTAVSGTTPNLAAKIQDSADNSAWADLAAGGSFTALTAVGAELITHATQSVRRYTRLSGTITGTTPSFTIAAALAKR